MEVNKWQIRLKNQSKEEKENVLYAKVLAHAKENADAKLPARNANVQLDENAAVDANLDKVDEEK